MSEDETQSDVRSDLAKSRSNGSDNQAASESSEEGAL